MTVSSSSCDFILHEGDKLGDLGDRQYEEDVRVDGGDVLEEYDLRPLKVLVGEGEHLVEGVEQHLDRVSEGVVRLADRGPDEEKARPDDELHEVLDAGEALLDRLLVLLGRDVVGEVAKAG